MSRYCRVAWTEGLFLRPQHFQQQDSYLENLVEARTRELRPYPWGFTELELDTELLLSGRLALLRAAGVLPDGTPFSLPGHTPPPEPLAISNDTNDEVIHLCLPLRKTEGALKRYANRELELPDRHAETESLAQVEVQDPILSLIPGSVARDDYACLGLARIQEVASSGQVMLDAGYIPPALRTAASPRLSGYIKEILGLLHNRGEAMAGGAVASGHSGMTEVVDLMWLQCINRFEPLFKHFLDLDRLHPERLYSACIQLAGDLSTYARDSRRPLQFPDYRHADLHGSFQPVMEDLRRSLSFVAEQNVIQVPLEYQGPGHGTGLYFAPMTEELGKTNLRALLDSSRFILGVKAELAAETIHFELPKQIKIGPVEYINRMVYSNLGGVAIAPTQPPRQLPYHAGYMYFELKQEGKYWQDLHKSNGLAFHVGDQYQDIAIELWAIRGAGHESK